MMMRKNGPARSPALWLISAGLLVTGIAIALGAPILLGGGHRDPADIAPEPSPPPPTATATASPLPSPTPSPTPSPLPTATPTPPPEASVPLFSPIDAAMKARLRAVHEVGLARGLRPNVFMKVGDSITVSGFFLTEFGCGGGNLGAHGDLAGVIAYFREAALPERWNWARCDTQNSFTRRSVAAGIGWSAIQVLVPFKTVEGGEATAAAIAAQATSAALGTPMAPGDGGPNPNVPPPDAGSSPDVPPAEGGPNPDVAPAEGGPNPDVPPAEGGPSPDAPPSAEGSTPGAPPPDGAAATPTARPTEAPPPECQAPPDNTPLRCELRLTQAGVALVMFGTNDLQAGIPPGQFAATMGRIVTELTDAGVIPILSTIPPRTDRQRANARVSAYNMAIVGVAEEHGVPLVNYWRMLYDAETVHRGMEWDGIHPNAAGYGGSLTDAGLRYGQNQRNLGVLTMLERVKRVVIEDGAPDG